MHKVGFIVYPGFQLVCLAASSVFEVADRVLDAPSYKVSASSALLPSRGAPSAP